MKPQNRSLRHLIDGPDVITLPGVYDGVSARIAESCGFSALYMTGFGAVASALGLPDVGTASYTEMLDRVRCIAGSVDVPLLADGDTGYGGLLNVDRTVRGYLAAGAAGIQLEDQEFPKKCGHTLGRRVIAPEDAARKIEVAAAARDSRDFVIVARTDARTGQGLDEALRRADRFLSAGADVLFIESPETLEELRRIAEVFRGVPLLANMVDGGRTPLLSAAELGALGFKIALFPVTGLLAASAALLGVYTDLRRSGSSAGVTVPLLPFVDMTRLMGFPQVTAFEDRWS
jgi:2,3-dimethylmalate lyase